MSMSEVDLLKYWEKEAQKMNNHKRWLKAIHWVANMLIIAVGVSIYAWSEYQNYVKVGGVLVSILSFFLLILNIEQRAKRLENYSRDLIELLFKYKQTDLENSVNKEALLADLKKIRDSHGFAPN